MLDCPVISADIVRVLYMQASDSRNVASMYDTAMALSPDELLRGAYGGSIARETCACIPSALHLPSGYMLLSLLMLMLAPS